MSDVVVRSSSRVVPPIVICQELAVSSEIGEFLAESFQQEALISRRKTLKLNKRIFNLSMSYWF